jgi:hypothetical protein
MLRPRRSGTSIGIINFVPDTEAPQEQITANSPIVFSALESHVVTYMGQMEQTSLSGNAQSAAEELKVYLTEFSSITEGKLLYQKV